MKTATENTRPIVQDRSPEYTIRIAMWKRTGGGVFPSPTQMEALHEQLDQTRPCLFNPSEF